MTLEEVHQYCADRIANGTPWIIGGRGSGRWTITFCLGFNEYPDHYWIMNEWEEYSAGHASFFYGRKIVEWLLSGVHKRYRQRFGRHKKRQLQFRGKHLWAKWTLIRMCNPNSRLLQ